MRDYRGDSDGEISIEFFDHNKEKIDYVTTGDYQYGADYPETYFLWQLGLSYQLLSSIAANAYYQSYNVPSGIAQFADAVPAVSEIIGFSLTYSF